MANKRMFTKFITDSDAFIEMPLSTQALYFHINMHADDDGFMNNPKKVQRIINASDDDLKLLIAKRFLLVFENGVIVVKHWRMHNTIRKDRYTPTRFQEELKSLAIKDNKSYTDDIANALKNGWQPLGNQCAPSDIDIGLDIDLDSDENKYIPAPKENKRKSEKVKHKYGEYNNVLLTDEELSKLQEEYPDYNKRIENLSNYLASTGKTYKSHYATIRNWARRENDKKAAQGNTRSQGNRALNMLREMGEIE